MDQPFPEQMLDDIKDFLSTDLAREPEQDLYPEVFQTGLFFPLQRQQELKRMMQIARQAKAEVVYEIGSDKGGGLYHWCKCLPTVRRVIACEIRGTPYRHLFEEAFPYIDFLWLEASSYADETVARIQQWLANDRIDALFIDGDKSAFEKDFDTMLPYMRPDGVVFMHDIQDRPPMMDFNRVVARGYRHQRIIDITDSHRAMQNERRGIPCSGSHEGWLRYWKGQSAGVGVIYLGAQP